jgi:hypothetical protein
MNIVVPELAAIEYFWDRLVPGAVVVLDDYAWGALPVRAGSPDVRVRRHTLADGGAVAPRSTLAAGLADTLAWWRERAAAGWDPTAGPA